MSKKPSKPTPAKPARAKSPKARRDMWIPPGRLYVYVLPNGGGMMDSTEARQRGTWLINAADWIEQQQNGGKRGK